jgi:hypothetical protein
MNGKTTMRLLGAILAGAALAGGLTATASAQLRTYYITSYYSDASERTIVGGEQGGCMGHRSWGQVTPYASYDSGVCGAPGHF